MRLKIMNINLKQYEVWFVTGSQHLYGPETLKKVAEHSQEIAKALNIAPAIPVKVVFKPVLVTPDAVTELCQAANNAAKCIGLITWCHTFSPSKMWINGLKQLRKPVAHLHTQYNRDIPWATIDMDFMNMNQAAHGDREHGFIWSRLRLARKVVVGFWQEKSTQEKLGAWARAAAAWADWQTAKFCRFGDNMREVAVTEGDKVSAQIKFGFAVNGYGVGDLVKVVNEVSEKEIDALVKTYEAVYEIAGDLKKGGKRHKSVREAARIELGLRAFLEGGNFKGFTTTFEDLHGLVQLPGLAPQRLDGRRLRFRRRRRLENRRARPRDESHGERPQRRHVVHGRLHLPSCARQQSRARRAHAGNLSEHRGRQGVVAGASARHRRQGRSGAPGFQHARRPGAERGADGFRQPLPSAHQRSGCRQTRTADAETARGAGRVEVPSEFRGRVRARGFTRAARITPASARRSRRKCSKTSRPSPGLEVVVIDADTKLRQFKQELVWNDCAYGMKSGWVS